MYPDKSFIEQENEKDIAYHNLKEDDTDSETKKHFYIDIISDKERLALLIFILLFTLIVPIGIYFIVTHLTFLPDIDFSCAVDLDFRVLCGKVNITKNECVEINCCYDDTISQCYHYIPAKYNYHRENANADIFQSLQSTSPFKKEVIESMKISILEKNPQTLELILHSSNITYGNDVVNGNNYYYVQTDVRILGIKVFRKNTSELILTTLLGPVIASYHYWEWSVHLSSEQLVGLGEIHYKKNVTVTKVIYKNKHDHNTLPNFICSNKGKFYGIRFEHDGPLEVTVLPSKLIILKSLAGYRIGVNVYTGPTLKDVIQQQNQEKIKTPLIPYWALGAHICRDGKTNLDTAIKEYVDFYNRPSEIHFASDCIHEDLYMMLHEANSGHNLENLIKDLQKNSHFVMSIPPQIPELNEDLYNAAVSLDVLISRSDGNYLNGLYRGLYVAYPDFNHTAIGLWFKELKQKLPSSSIDGFVLKDNWPEEEEYVFQDQTLQFPYMTRELNWSLSYTIPWDIFSNNALPQPHIMQHNLYGKYQTIAFKNNMQYQLLLTSSYNHEIAEPALVQNVDISWTSLKKTLTTILYNSILGNHLISTPICGSTNKYDIKTDEDICLRWYIMAATFPLFRISSDFPRRDPSQLTTGFVKYNVLNAIQRRYMFLPYYYTTLSLNEPLVRPMFYNFPTNNETWNLEHQYMLGNSLIVAQPLAPAVSNIEIYLPTEIEVWYEFWGGNPYVNEEWLIFNILKDDWILFIAEGHTIPIRNHNSKIVGEFTENDSFNFGVALKCVSTKCYSKGHVQLSTSNLTITADENGIKIEHILEAQNDIDCSLKYPKHPKYISSVNIYGLRDTVIKSNFSTIDLCKEKNESLIVPYFLI